MSIEREWERAPEDLLPEDRKVIEADIHYWDQKLATLFGFPDLVPDIDKGVSYYVGVGMNAGGEVIGAVLLSDQPIERKQEHWIRERLELFLQNKARKIFGLVPPENMV